MRAALRKNSDRVESLTRAESRFQKCRVNSRSAFNAMQDEQNERMELIASNFVVQHTRLDSRHAEISLLSTTAYAEA